jgi:hypothetical protein
MLNFLFQFLIQISFILYICHSNYAFCHKPIENVEKVILEKIQNRNPLIGKVRKSLIHFITGEKLDQISNLFGKQKVNVMKVTPVDIFQFIRNLYITRNAVSSDERNLYAAKQLNFLILETDLLNDHNFTVINALGHAFVECDLCDDPKVLASIVNESFEFLKSLNIESAYLEDINSYDSYLEVNNTLNLIALPMFLHLKKIVLSDEVQQDYIEGSEFYLTFTKERFSDLPSPSPSFSKLSNKILNQIETAKTIRASVLNSFNLLNKPEFLKLKNRPLALLNHQLEISNFKS